MNDLNNTPIGYQKVGLSIISDNSILLDESGNIPFINVEDTDQSYLQAANRLFDIDLIPDNISWLLASNYSDSRAIIFGIKLDDLPQLSDSYTWTTLEDIGDAINPESEPYLKRWFWDESYISKEIQAGNLIGPNTYKNQVLFPMRITGTGDAFRPDVAEFTFRDPSFILNDEFMERCKGLHILWEHTQEQYTDNNTVKRQAIGIVTYPYIKGDELWCVAKINDIEAATRIATGAYSTSPGFTVNVNSTDHNGITFTYEGKVIHLDHLAVVDMGVWDKLSMPSGIDAPITLRPIPLSFIKENKMEDDVKKDDVSNDRLDRLESLVESLIKGLSANKEKVEDAKEDEKEKLEDKKDDLLDDTSDVLDDEVVEDKKDDEMKKDEVVDKSKDEVIESLRKQVDALTASMPRDLSDEERDELSCAESKADSVFMAMGEKNIRPLMNEKPLAYRRRIAKRLQAHSKAYKSLDLSKLDALSFETIESAIYKDATTFAQTPVMSNTGLIAVREKAFGGREKVSYRGSVGAFLKPYSEMPKKAKLNNFKGV